MLEIDAISKTFTVDRKAVPVLDRVSLSVAENEFLSIVGTSGCGKSTLLNILAGLEDASDGTVRIDGRPIRGPGRDRGVVFQGYSLFEWMTVEGNIRFALEKSDLPAAEKSERVAHFIAAVGLRGFERAYPAQLSGGMRQRVAIARALVYRPRILLMDEPFGALDAQTRGMMQELLLQIWEDHKATVIFITHDVDEALFLSDRVVVLAARPGRIRREITVPLPRPRAFDIVTEAPFMALKREILTEIRAETLRAMGQEAGA